MTAPRGLQLAPHLAVMSLGYVVFAPAAVPTVLTTRLDIGFGSFGLLVSAALGAFVVAQPLASRLTDRHTTTRLLLYSIAAHVVLAVALDFFTTFSLLVVFRFLWGLASGFVLSVGATHNARLHTGSASTLQQGVYGGILTLGGAVGFLLVPQFVSMTVVPLGLVHTPGALIALPALALCFRYRNDTRTTPPPTTAADRRGRVFTHPVVLLTGLVYVAIIGSYVTLSTFVTAYYTDLGVVGPLNALVLVVATVGRSLGGAVGIDDATVIGGGTGLAVLGFGALAVGGPPLVVAALPLVAMLAVAVPFGSVYAVAARATARDGAALAFVLAVGNVAALVLPAVTGIVRDITGTYDVSFTLLAGLNVAAFAAAVALRRTTYA